MVLRVFFRHRHAHAPIGMAYALGIVLVFLTGVMVFKQRFDMSACIGMGLIVPGDSGQHVLKGSAE